MRRFLRLEWLISPPYARWCRRGAALGVALGVLVFAALLLSALPAQPIDGGDSAELLGYQLILLGFPFSMVVTPFASLGAVVAYAWLLLSAAATWAIIGASIGGLASFVYFRARGS
jgi:hypothetical protein